MTDVAVKTGAGVVPVYVAEPGSPPSRAVIVVQEAFGVNDHIREVTSRLADLGYLGLAPHIFHRNGVSEIPYDALKDAMEHIKGMNGPDILTDIDACISYAAGRGIEGRAVGAVGFCMGGTITFFAASERELGAAVSFYGGGVAASRWEGVPSMVDQADPLGCAWLGLYGDEDQGIPIADVEALREALRSNPVPTEIVRYAGAGHGFHCDARPDVYREGPAKDAWARTVAWFEEYLDPRDDR